MSPRHTVSQCLCLIQCCEELVGVEEIIHVDSRPMIWQLESKPHNALRHRGRIIMLERCWEIGRLGTSKQKGVRVAAITHGIALEAITFALVGNPYLEAQRALKTDRLLVNRDKLPRHPHAACLLVQLIG
jgi:hypothetical protein